VGIVLLAIDGQFGQAAGPVRSAVGSALWAVYGAFSVIAGAAAWFLVLEQEIDAQKKTGAQLQKAKERAESANVAKTRYVVGISHELRTPLNAIFGYAQLLERDATLLKPQLESVRVMRRSAEHLANLVDGLLDI